MGSATVQGRLWAMHARDFAAYLEQVALPLHGAVLDAAHVAPGTRLLDAGCGAGLLALLASLRGARVTALDASAALLAIVRERLPAADVREGDLEALPFADASFDAVTAVNSLFLDCCPGQYRLLPGSLIWSQKSRGLVPASPVGSGPLPALP